MVNTSEPISSSKEISKISETITNLQTAVGTIQIDLAKVTYSVGSDVSDLKKMMEIMIGKPQELEATPKVSDGESEDEDTVPDPSQIGRASCRERV